MGRKRAGRPALPKHKRCHKAVDSRPYYTDAMRAFDLGRAGEPAPAYIMQDKGLWLKYCGGKKQRQLVVDAFRRAGKIPKLSDYERAQEAAERRQIDENAALARSILEKRGLPVTTRTINNLIRELQVQAQYA